MFESENYPIIHSLDVDTLASGQHHFWFSAATNAMGMAIQLPVVVIKAEAPGPKVMITAGVHGDELNGVLTSHELVRRLPEKLTAGTVTIVPSINPSGVLRHSRDFHSSDPDSSSANLNRFFPGNAEGDAANRYLHTIWTQLLKRNADIAIDLHTQTQGATYPLYVFADFRLKQSLLMARLIEPDVILNDPGDSGVLETVWNNSGVPCITVEVGMGKITQPELIQRTVEGVQRILTQQGVVKGEMPKVVKCDIEGEEIISVRATQGGFVIPTVNLLERVNQGQLLAKQYDSFGRFMCDYCAPKAATVLSYNVDSLREPGGLVVRLIR
ncbi:Succinylglutamate desuccinylase / Aspartoacylase family protein [Vibrio thalassae]|uniref:Succinylglutamate desuccinylase / Aspartoacylase family protein n=1 Tax=Vibrio thalassae TaxID=1243014 RepID=A0A240EKK7_9VIBR|nr:succinylglutamate desuccinylase/aspartoacylase family protein [Vibrio thalassae]SNX48525.1 Succinylglutamate desuccinylase / Aspartoacylase family protein [Vibrio thalassae]